MSTFAHKVIAFNKSLTLDIKLPDGLRIMNPFKENPEALEISSVFYRKYYSDQRKRRLILGINPGRFGAGVTGVPFTDTKRLQEKCELHIPGTITHEPSSVFVYEVIDAYGGVEKFYGDFYINSISPLGFVTLNSKNREINYNYYDSKELQEAITPFAIQSIRDHISMGCLTDICYCLGTGKNLKFLTKLNGECGFFKEIIPLEHPRYIMQYKSSMKDEYISRYLNAFTLPANNGQINRQISK
jgi:hypothetical protein